MKNTAALQSFATASRRSLNEQMRARITQLLDNPHAALEYPREITMLKSAVAGGGVDGAAEQAAYTWFNRLTAARYMDVNGFSGLYRIVSPEMGSASALPEILTRAHAGEFPDEVPDDVRSAVIDLLSGTRVSQDRDLEAYTLLLQAIFRAWHAPMPEVFPAAVDWIRLLTPVDILASNSVRAQAVQIMDDEACENVEVVGWLYQFYNAELKAQINDAKTPIDAAELPPVTQLFTPHWIVRYLVENSLGRLWLRSKPSSGLRDSMEYYVDPVPGQADTGVTVSSPEEIRVVDPACGSGHMLTYAFDLLYAIYEEEGRRQSTIPQLILRNNLRGMEIDTRAAQLASFALAMKARRLDRRFLTRDARPDIIHIEPVSFTEDEVQVIVDAVAHEDAAVDRVALVRLLYSFTDADTFGSLARVDGDVVASLEAQLKALEHGTHGLYIHRAVDRLKTLVHQAKSLVDSQYHVVVANPPYLGSGNMGSLLKGWIEKNYSDAKGDLLTAFMVRATEISVPSGQWGMIVLPSWMFLKTFAKFRGWLLKTQRIESFLHLGRGLFGSDFGSDAFVMTNAPASPGYGAIYRRLFEEHVQVRKPEVIEALFKSSSYGRFVTLQSDFSLIPDLPIVYWLSDAMKDAFTKGVRLSEIASPRQGLATADNDRFLRQWFEVSSSHIGFGMANGFEAKESGLLWFPYNKGGAFRKWWGNQGYVVDWQNDGHAIRNFVDASGKQRSRPQNTDLYFKPCISWSNVSSGPPSFREYPSEFIFSHVGQAVFASSTEMIYLMGFLNSSICEKMLAVLSPTLHFEVGHIANLPILPADPRAVAGMVEELVSLFRADWNDYETSWHFERNPLASCGHGTLESHAETIWDRAISNTHSAQKLEEKNNSYFASLYGLEGEVATEIPLSRISLARNPYFRYAPAKNSSLSDREYREMFDRDLARELISYAVGCIVGRYSLDRPGLVLTDATSAISDLDSRVLNSEFSASVDGIIPITAERYFEDDIATRLREFLSAAFGAEHVDANVSWLENALGSGKPMPLRKYFLDKFYSDHVQMYSKRPIYWQVSSPKGNFNALFYLHRYIPATLGLIHQNYAEEYCIKLEARVEHIDHALLTAPKGEATKLRKEREQLGVELREVRTWIDSHLFPAATAEIELDLDDGVKQNYPKLAGVVKKVSGL
ncbi:BREX-1 system adenine-specific DNA-methyltransferase PglX [Nocardia sp. NPDC052112]|uniref:BREX-1 system adenine-specific DNA-methyltransferase PglX n=1 Tax=Nocardia sp. NPDC052112 TaxID=3155646 RepID=UPI00341C3DC2